jgi:hypothetical protein
LVMVYGDIHRGVQAVFLDKMTDSRIQFSFIIFSLVNGMT